MFRQFIILLIAVFLIGSCGAPPKLKPSERGKETRKIFRQKTRAYKKEIRKKRRNKRRSGYYNKDNAVLYPKCLIITRIT